MRRREGRERQSTRQPVPKLCGADVELGNFLLGVEDQRGSGYEASQLLLRAIGRVTPVIKPRWEEPARDRNPNWETEAGHGWDPQDWGRSYLLANGGCAYIDLEHLELCLPEVRSAFDHTSCWHAMLRVAQAALRGTNRERPQTQKLQALVNNSDGLGNSYGSHLNFLMDRSAWRDLLERKPHFLAFLAAYQASSIVFTGQGKVGSENRLPWVDFQISQRADFTETLTGPQTTYRRPLINTRDESLCGSPGTAASPYLGLANGELARLHVICYDSNLCQVAHLLKVGVMQIILAMLEVGPVNHELALEDPLSALQQWSRDPSLETRAALVSGRQVTAVELQLLFLEEARAFAAAECDDDNVPRANDILALWEDTLRKLEHHEWGALAKRVDWVLKRSLLTRLIEQQPGLEWDSPEVKHLDLLYSSLDPHEGIYWAFARQGLVETVVPEQRIGEFLRFPPEDTRAWGRTMLLRLAGRSRVEIVDWDHVRFRLEAPHGLATHWLVEFPNPLLGTRRMLRSVFEGCRSLEDALAALEARQLHISDLSSPPPVTSVAGVRPGARRQ